MFENLTDRLEKSFQMLKGEGKINELNVAETLKDIRKALLDADVNYKVAKQFTDNVMQKAMGQDVLKSVKPGQMMVSIVYEELTSVMGGDAVDVNIKGQPAIVLMSGLQGSGKTTFACKLANQFKSKRGKKPLLVAGDVYRPAAINQLQVLGEQIGVPVFTEEGNSNPVDLAQKGIAKAKAAIRKAFRNSLEGRGSSLVEIVSTCSAGWKMTPVEAGQWMEENLFPYYPLGDLKDTTR